MWCGVMRACMHAWARYVPLLPEGGPGASADACMHAPARLAAPGGGLTCMHPRMSSCARRASRACGVCASQSPRSWTQRATHSCASAGHTASSAATSSSLQARGGSACARAKRACYLPRLHACPHMVLRRSTSTAGMHAGAAHACMRTHALHAASPCACRTVCAPHPAGSCAPRAAQGCGWGEAPRAAHPLPLLLPCHPGLLLETPTWIDVCGFLTLTWTTACQALGASPSGGIPQRDAARPLAPRR